MNEDNDKLKKENDIPPDPEAALRKERDEYLDGWRRAKADLINYKKDEAERMREFVKFANEGVISDCLNVMDSLDLGITALPEGNSGRKGIEVIRTQFREILRRYGVEMFTVERGDPFDPSRMEAVGETDSAAPPGTVAELIRPGYSVNGRVTRPAQVRISKGSIK